MLLDSIYISLKALYNSSCSFLCVFQCWHQEGVLLPSSLSSFCCLDCFRTCNCWTWFLPFESYKMLSISLWRMCVQKCWEVIHFSQGRWKKIWKVAPDQFDLSRFIWCEVYVWACNKDIDDLLYRRFSYQDFCPAHMYWKLKNKDSFTPPSIYILT